MVNKLKNIGAYFGRLLFFGFIWYQLLGLVFNQPFFPNKHTDPQTVKYIGTFLERCTQYGTDCSKIEKLSIGVRKLPWHLKLLGPVIGVCNTAHVQIILKEEYWKEATEITRELLAIHELAHCILDKEHDEDGLQIMNPAIMSDHEYLQNYQLHFNRLFDCSKNCPVIKFDIGRYL